MRNLQVNHEIAAQTRRNLGLRLRPRVNSAAWRLRPRGATRPQGPTASAPAESLAVSIDMPVAPAMPPKETHETPVHVDTLHYSGDDCNASFSPLSVRTATQASTSYKSQDNRRVGARTTRVIDKDDEIRYVLELINHWEPSKVHRLAPTRTVASCGIERTEIRMGPITRAAVAVGIWAFTLAGAAQASYVYQGNDFSYGTDLNRRAVICDQETDSHGTHADANSFAGNSYQVDDLDGAGGECFETGRMSSGLAKHRTVEELSWRPDAKSGWSYH